MRPISGVNLNPWPENPAATVMSPTRSIRKSLVSALGAAEHSDEPVALDRSLAGYGVSALRTCSSIPRSVCRARSCLSW
jgi:hypothetical protein